MNEKEEKSETDIYEQLNEQIIDVLKRIDL